MLARARSGGVGGRENSVAFQDLAYGQGEFDRASTELEDAAGVRFQEMDRGLDEWLARYAQRVERVQVSQLDAVAGELEGAMARGDLERLRRLEVPREGKLANEVEEVLFEVHEGGRDSVREELLRQAHRNRAEGTAGGRERDLGVARERAVKMFGAEKREMIARAEESARVLTAKLRTSLVFFAMEAMRRGEADAGAVRLRVDERSDAAVMDEARAGVHLAWNLGRQLVGRSLMGAR